MPKQRKPGDIVRKKPMAGFSARAGVGLIPPGSEPDEFPCDYCGDPSCREWPDLWELGQDGEPTGEVWCHVAECQMEDIGDAES